MQWRCLQVTPWVPQNDILGHPSTKAFLSHVGANGLNEVMHPLTRPGPLLKGHTSGLGQEAVALKWHGA